MQRSSNVRRHSGEQSEWVEFFFGIPSIASKGTRTDVTFKFAFTVLSANGRQRQLPVPIDRLLVTLVETGPLRSSLANMLKAQRSRQQNRLKTMIKFKQIQIKSKHRKLIKELGAYLACCGMQKLCCGKTSIGCTVLHPLKQNTYYILWLVVDAVQTIAKIGCFQLQSVSCKTCINYICNS